MTTHTEALMNLEKLGYEKLARLGWAGHSVHIGEPVPSVDPKAKRQDTTVSLAQIMSNAFWEDEDKLAQWNQSWHLSKNRNGDWIAAGHLFKVLYSYHRMVARAKDEQQVRLCSKVLLERYFNPNVMGG
jgi:hypothetical protein